MDDWFNDADRRICRFFVLDIGHISKLGKPRVAFGENHSHNGGVDGGIKVQISEAQGFLHTRF